MYVSICRQNRLNTLSKDGSTAFLESTLHLYLLQFYILLICYFRLSQYRRGYYSTASSTHKHTLEVVSSNKGTHQDAYLRERSVV